MDISNLIIGGIAVLLVVYAIVLYNGLVSLKHNVSKNLANIDVLLKQRHDELPKLIETCKQYMKHEQETLEKVIHARSSVANAQKSGDVKALGKAETVMRAGLGNLFALAENYPELKADQSFTHLQDRISGLESEISDRREFYNESVNNNNIRLEQFPDVLVARFGNFKAFDLLEFSEQELADVDVKSLFS
ncbi:LemA family protein [Gammaproteobacteria bacterium 45_16_T64]|nr:LemA family protein [Gammaproteobacteria bacterium 45_16_T64]